MTTNPISHEPQPRELDGRFGHKHLAEVPAIELVDAGQEANQDHLEAEHLDRVQKVATDLAAMLGDPDYKTPAQQLEERWSRDPHRNGIVPAPLDPKVVALNETTAVCPMCDGSGKTWAATEVECYLCEGQPGIPLTVADEFVKDVKKTFGGRPSSEPDYESIAEDRAWSRFGGIVEAEEWGGLDVPS